MDICKENGAYDAKHFLCYYYYGGMIYTGLKNFERALYFYEQVTWNEIISLKCDLWKGKRRCVTVLREHFWTDTSKLSLEVFSFKKVFYSLVAPRSCAAQRVMLNLSHYKYFSAACLELQHRNRSWADTRLCVLKKYSSGFAEDFSAFMRGVMLLQGCHNICWLCFIWERKENSKIGKTSCMREMLWNVQNKFGQRFSFL